MFKEEILSRMCDGLVEVINDSRDELATYRDLLEITDRMKKSEVRKSGSGTGPGESALDRVLSRKSQERGPYQPVSPRRARLLDRWI